MASSSCPAAPAPAPAIGIGIGDDLICEPLATTASIDTNISNSKCIEEEVKLYEPSYSHAFSMRYGLFVHWAGGANGQGTGIVHSDGTFIGTNIDEYASTIQVQRVADEIKALGFEYLILTNFHGIGTMLHPSEASDRWRGPGYATNQIDVIGNIIKELKIRNIAVILFTHPLDGHDYRPQDRDDLLGWNDPTHNYRRWNDFINDVYVEIVQKYGQHIMGIGFDSEFGLTNNAQWHKKLDLTRLRRTILSRAPHIQLYALAGPNDCCEFGMKEVWRPSWLDPVRSFQENDWGHQIESWPSYRRLVGIVQTDHWATIKAADKGIVHFNAVQIYRYSVLQAATATEGPGVAWAASPYADGTWERSVREVFAEVENIRKDVREALSNVYPSTSYPTPEGMKLKDLPYGIVATKSVDDLIEYIHVMNPPEEAEEGNSKVLILPRPQDDKVFTSAKVLRSGHSVKLSILEDDDDKVRIELLDNEEWDIRRTTILALSVEEDGSSRKNLALYRPVIFSSSKQMEPRWPPKSSHGSIRVNNGRRSTAYVVMNGDGDDGDDYFGGVGGGNTPYSSPSLMRIPGWSTGSLGWSSQGKEKDDDDDDDEEEHEWVGIDLVEAVEVGSVVLYPRNDVGHEGEGFPVRISLEVAMDRNDNDQKWQCVKEEEIGVGVAMDSSGTSSSNFGRPWVVVLDPPVLCRMVRVVGLEVRPSGDGSVRMQIAEFEIYGHP